MVHSDTAHHRPVDRVVDSIHHVVDPIHGIFFRKIICWLFLFQEVLRRGPYVTLYFYQAIFLRKLIPK
jgi:hypothetical protein